MATRDELVTCERYFAQIVPIQVKYFQTVSIETKNTMKRLNRIAGISNLMSLNFSSSGN